MFSDGYHYVSNVVSFSHFNVPINLYVFQDGSSENCTLLFNSTLTDSSTTIAGSGANTSVFTSDVQPLLPSNYTSFDDWNGTLLVCLYIKAIDMMSCLSTPS